MIIFVHIYVADSQRHTFLQIFFPFTTMCVFLRISYALQISEDDVRQVFRKNKRRKAPGPDGVTPACLKTCADQLAPIFSQITGAVRSPFLLQMLHHHPHPKETPNYWTWWLQTCNYNICGNEVIWKTGAGLSEGHHWTLTGPPAVCLPSKQDCGWCSQHGIALHPAASRQTRNLWEDPVCGPQLCF